MNAGMATESTAEFRLLAALAQPNSEVGVDAALDWTKFLALAERHRVSPVVYRRLAALAPAEVPAPVLHSLQQRYAENARRALLLAAETARIVELLTATGVQAAPFKGCVLAQQVYGDVGYRHAGDIDLLIDAGDYPAADRALAGQDFVRQVPRRPPDGHALHGLQRRRKDAVYVHPRLGYVLELHWRLFELPGYFPLAAAFTGNVVLAGRSLPAMTTQTLALYVCAHGAWCGWFRLKWLADAQRLLSACDRRQMQALARRLGLERVLALTLALCAGVFGAPAPVTGGPRLPRALLTYPFWALQDADPYPGRPRSPAITLHRLRYHTQLRADLDSKIGTLYLLAARAQRHYTGAIAKIWKPAHAG